MAVYHEQVPVSMNEPVDELAGRLTPISAATPSAAVAAQLLKYFTSGDIEKGTRLPPERQLAEALGTGRSAVREALAALEILGVVQIRPGSGTYLRGSLSELLPQTLSWGLMLGEQRVAELVEIRTSLELLATELAAKKIDDSALARLEMHVDVMAANSQDQAAFVEADMRFHQEIAAATDNAALNGLLQSVRSLLRIWVDRAVRTEDEIVAAVTEHRDVLEAIKNRDSQAARSAMARHMETAGERVQKTAAAGGAE